MTTSHDTRRNSDASPRAITALLWALLALIPVLTLGPAVGRYGPVTDDWSHLRLVIDGAFVNVDLTRPLHHVTTAAAYALAGGSVTAMTALLVALQAVEAILCFEVLRRMLTSPAARLPGRLAVFAAFSGAAVFALYPADVSRLTLMMTHGRIMLIATLALALVWLDAARTRRSWPLLPAALSAGAVLLIKESPFFVLALMPGLVLLWPETLRLLRRGRWITALAAWYGVLGAYAVWRFVLIPPVVAEVTERPMREVSISGVTDLLLGTARALTRFMGSIFTATYGEHTSGLALGRPLDALPLIALAAAGGLLLAAFAVTRRLPDQGGRVSARFALILGVVGLAVWLGGAAPYLLRDPDSLIIYNIASRDTQVANLGAALLWLAAGLLAAALLERVGASRWRVLPLAVIGAALVAVAVVRHTHTVYDAVDAWQVQHALWLELEALPLDLPEDGSGVLLLTGFPYDTRNAMYISDSWAYRDGIYLLFGRSLTALPVHEVDVTALDDESIALTFKRRPRTFTSPLDALRVAAYDAASGRVMLIDSLPEALGQGPLPLSTGDASRARPSTRTAFGVQLLGAP